MSGTRILRVGYANSRAGRPRHPNHESVLTMGPFTQNLSNLITSRCELLQRRLLFIDPRSPEGNPDSGFVWYFRAAHFDVVKVAWQEIRSVFGGPRQILDYRHFVICAAVVLQSEPQMIRDEIFECI